MRQTMQVETRPTITEFLLREQRRVPAATGTFTAVVNNVRLACKRIAHVIGQGALAGAGGTAGTQNVQGETQMQLDVLADEIFVRTNEWSGTLAGLVSEEREDWCRSPRSTRAGATCWCSIRWTAPPTST